MRKGWLEGGLAPGCVLQLCERSAASCCALECMPAGLGLKLNCCCACVSCSEISGAWLT